MKEAQRTGGPRARILGELDDGGVPSLLSTCEPRQAVLFFFPWPRGAGPSVYSGMKYENSRTGFKGGFTYASVPNFGHTYTRADLPVLPYVLWNSQMS